MHAILELLTWIKSNDQYYPYEEQMKMNMIALFNLL